MSYQQRTMSEPEQNLAVQVEMWRSKARAGILTREEMKEAIKALRAGRALIAVATGGSKSKKAGVPKPSGDDLLSELEGL